MLFVCFLPMHVKVIELTSVTASNDFKLWEELDVICDTEVPMETSSW